MKTNTTDFGIRGTTGVVFVALSLCLPSCRAQVLSLGSESQALQGIDTRTTIAGLTEAQDSQVCNWLVAEFPFADQKPPRVSQGGIISPGYVNGAVTGCEDPTTMDEFTWPLLDQKNCILNLRHSPCASTLKSLTQCVSAAVAGSADNDLCKAKAACATFLADPACTETVFQTTARGDGPCAGSLPIEPNVRCVDPGAIDGGAD